MNLKPLLYSSLLYFTAATAYADGVCQTTSRGYLFQAQGLNPSFAAQDAVAQCQRSAMTSDAECAANVICSTIGSVGQPPYPGQPTYPTQPSYPSQPSYPTQPAYPTYPTYPSQPSYPSQPNYPTYPSQPGYPGNNGGWNQGGGHHGVPGGGVPGGGVGPRPTYPTYPTYPTQPSYPRPTQPTYPSQPSYPTYPTVPAQPPRPDAGQCYLNRYPDICINSPKNYCKDPAKHYREHGQSENRIWGCQ